MPVGPRYGPTGPDTLLLLRSEFTRVERVMGKERAQQVFNENNGIFDNGWYHGPKTGKVHVGYEATTLYTPDELSRLMPLPGNGDLPKIEVVEGTTGDTGRRLAKKTGGHVALLNFASAKNAGGGYVRGTKAQEEDLCRCSLLYHALKEQPGYYRANRKCGTNLYTDHMIYTQGASFFRADGTYNLLDAEDVVKLDVITAPAPNAGAAMEGPAEAETALRRRAGYVLAVAASRGVSDLVLGAWGCGVFRNDPEMVADAFGHWLESDGFRGAFKRVVFAIYAQSLPGQVNLEVFRRRFAEVG